MGQKQKKVKTGATGLGRITREQTQKWNQMTALRFNTGKGDLSESDSPFPSKLGQFPSFWPAPWTRFLQGRTSSSPLCSRRSTLASLHHWAHRRARTSCQTGRPGHRSDVRSDVWHLQGFKRIMKVFINFNEADLGQTGKGRKFSVGPIVP